MMIFLYATNARCQEIAKYAGEFLSIGTGARYLGMGGTSAAFANDVNGLYWNPAALSHINYLQVGGMFAQGFGGLLNYQHIAIASPLDSNKAVGISMLRLGIDNIPDTRDAWDYQRNHPKENADLLIKRFNASDYAFFLSFAMNTSFHVRFGTNFKIIYRHIGDIGYAWGVGVDIGASYKLPFGFSIGLTLQDITTTLLSWSSGRKELISPTLKFGIANTLEDFLFGMLTVAVDMDWRFENRTSNTLVSIGAATMTLRTGIEYVFYDAVAIRGGVEDLSLLYTQSKDTPTISGKWTIGAGIRIAFLAIDYAFAEFANDGLGSTHRVSLTVQIEHSLFRRTGYEEKQKHDILKEIDKLFKASPAPERFNP